MRLLCVALLFAGCAQAGELLPLTGKESEHVQATLNEVLRPAVLALNPDVKVEPILERVRLSGRAKRIFLGPLAGGSYVVLRIRVTDASGTKEQVFSDETGAWRGTFKPGEDYEMLERVAAKAAEFVAHCFVK